VCCRVAVTQVFYGCTQDGEWCQQFMGDVSEDETHLQTFSNAYCTHKNPSEKDDKGDNEGYDNPDIDVYDVHIYSFIGCEDTYFLLIIDNFCPKKC
jgi:hypothetical protein